MQFLDFMFRNGKTSRTTVVTMTGDIAKGKQQTSMTYHKCPLQRLSIGRRQFTLPFAATSGTKILIWEGTQVMRIIKRIQPVLQVELRMR